MFIYSLELTGTGFKDLAQSLINLGAMHGNVKVEDVLVSRRTLSRGVLHEQYDRIKNNVKMLLSDRHIALTTDMWTDKYTQRSFLTLSCHYIDNDFNLCVNILGNREFTLGKIQQMFEILRVCAPKPKRFYISIQCVSLKKIKNHKDRKQKHTFHLRKQILCLPKCHILCYRPHYTVLANYIVSKFFENF